MRSLRALFLGSLIAGVAWLPTARAAPTAAGTAIANTAAASYIDSTSGLNVRLTSNTVSTVVQPLEALTLTSSQSAGSSPSTTFSLAHQLTNTGNVATAYVLTVTTAGGSFAATGLSIVADTNGNGVADPGEMVIANGATVTLVPGGLQNLLIVATVPAAAQAGQSEQFKLTAQSRAQGVAATNIDTITLVNGPVVALTKSASTDAPVPGGTVTYALNAQNAGASAANPVAITVNGVAGNYVVVRDAIPANTTFASAAASTPAAQVLYHRTGDAPKSYVTAASSNNGTPAGLDAVAWASAALPPGGSLVGTLTVTVNGNAAGTLGNTGYVDFNAQGADTTVGSNPVQLTLPPLAPTIRFYSSNTYATPTQQGALASPLYMQINMSQCNTDPTVIVTHPVTLVSQLTGDSEIFTATETAPNSGIFRVLPSVPTANGATHVVAAGDGILEVLPNDHVVATLAGCGMAAVSANLLIDPSGTVFNSKTGAPVTGATVQLIDVSGAGNGGHAGGGATVFAGDGVTPAPSSLVTGVDGGYSFPFVPASTYRLVVMPPNGLSFPSKLPPGLLPATRNVITPGSYGGNFSLMVNGSPMTFDIPLDGGAAVGLFVDKVANKTMAAVGDFVDYSVTVSNNTGITLPALVINDELPAGFAYVAGSARLNGMPMTNPAGGAGPLLAFGVGSLPPVTPAVVSYRVRIGPAGASGGGINTARAISGPTQSNVATASVKVTGSVLSDKAYLFGKVYADCNRDRSDDAGDSGIPGVRVYLDDGTYAVTDIEGKYSLYGLTPRTHVAKLDVTTLPAGGRLEVLNHRNALDPGSQFLDLKNGELHQADFAIGGCSDGVRDEIVARRMAMKGGRSEILAAGTSQIQVNTAPVSDTRTLAPSGVVGQRNLSSADGTRAARTGTDSTVAASGFPTDVTAKPAGNETLADELVVLSPDAGFIGLDDGAVVATAQTRVRVKGPFGAQLKLSVNGRDLGMDRVGEQSSLESRGVTAWEYVGVDLEPGSNTLELRVVDAFGNTRATRAVHLVAPGALSTIHVTAPPHSSADVQTPVEIAVELRDSSGVPVTARTAVTLESSLGEWQTPDLDPKEPGTQVFIEGGRSTFKLLPPSAAGQASVRVSSGMLRAESSITFEPNLRPMLAAGLVEGTLSLHNLNPGALVPTQGNDSFEREIETTSRSFDDGRGSGAARASMFLKGKILGSSLLTMAYDSDKPNDTPLFRDIQPDQFYPVYGDSSVKGYEAESTGKLYVRVDHGTSYGMYGDFSTQSDNPGRVLSQYTRALNGAKTHLQQGGLTLDAFVSDTNSTQVIDELPANGTSGPYQLTQRNPVANSQRVDIITRDRNQPSLVLADTPLTQFTDYAVEPFAGQILFKASVPSLDANLNPIYIRVVYEVSGGGPNYWVGGVDAREKLAGGVTVGGTVVRDTNPVSRETLGGANVVWTPAHDTTLVAEVAQSEADLEGTGKAHRIELKHIDARIQARLYAVQTDATFDNPSSTYTAGSAEYGAKVSAAFDAKNRLLIEALKTTTSGTSIQSPLSIPVVGLSEGVPGGGSREGDSIALEHTFMKNLKVTAGVRHVESNGIATQALALGAAPTEYTSARMRIDVPVPYLPRATAFAQYEEAVDRQDLKDTTLGATYQVAAQTKVYATHQSSNSLSGDYALSPAQQNDLTVVGIDTTYMQDGKMFDEYRVGDGIDGRSARAAIGLRNLFTLGPGLGVTTSIQQVHPLSGVVADRATALTAGLQYTANPDWKGSTRIEWSKSQTAETWLSSLGAAVKINADVTGLARGVYNEQLALGGNLSSAGVGVTPATAVGPGSIYLRQQQIGIAYRPVDSNVWNALAWVEHKRSLNATLGIGLNVDESADMFSSHVNVDVTPDWLINGRYGIKRAVDYANGMTTPYTAQILGTRSIWDLNERWDFGLQYFIETGAITAARQQAAGAEVGYLVMQNVWLSVGYNVTGFRDADLASEDYTQTAFYLRVRVKFDEQLFKPRNNSQPLPANAAVMQ